MNQRHTALIFSISLLAFAGGCVSHRIDLTESGHVTLEKHSPGKVKSLWSHAYEADGRLIVNGILKRQDHSAMPIPAHVHVLVISDNEQIAQSLQTTELYVPRNRTGKGNDWKRLEVRSTTIPLPGSNILVIVHNRLLHHDICLSLCQKARGRQTFQFWDRKSQRTRRICQCCCTCRSSVDDGTRIDTPAVLTTRNPL